MENTVITPCVVIPGFGQSKAYMTEKDGTVKKVWPLNIDVKKAAKKIAPAYFKTVIARKDKGFTDTAYGLFREVFDPFTYDENGEANFSIDATGTDAPLSEYAEGARSFVRKIAPVRSLCESIGENNVFCFSYNAFDASFVTARKLDGFISGVKKRTGSQKVNLVCFSMGGSVAAAYFNDYGNKKDVSRAVFVSSCLGGSAIQESILTRNIDKNMGYSLLGFISGGDAVKLFKRVLSLTTWDVRYRLLYRSLDAVQDSLLTTSPGMWGMLPPAVSEEYRDILLADKKYARLCEKIARIEDINRGTAGALKQAETDGTQIYIIAGYGSRIMPLCADDKLNTDGILAVVSSAPGAVASPLGEKLPSGKRLSPDGQIDAADCLFPERTWFFKGETHSSIVRSDKIDALVREMLTSENGTDVHSSVNAAQFG